MPSMRIRVSRAGSSLALALALGGALATAGGGQRVGAGGGGPPSTSAATALAQPGPPGSLATDRIYFVMTDRYANGDPSNDTGGVSGTRDVTGYDPTSTAWWHGGDFKGLTGSCTDPLHGLARIKALGFNAIWVTPPVVNQVSLGGSGGYHGYWGLDFTRVDPHLGTNDDFANFVSCAHGLGMKVIMDVVVNHTGDIIRLAGAGYSSKPYRDCHGKVFDPARYTSRTFPCLSLAGMPRRPIVPAGERNAKSPAWLNDPLNYHDRGDLSFSGPCDETCLEQGDFFGLDDLFTEKPNVEKGLARIYADWIARYKLDGFRVDTARHLNAAFFRLWVPQILTAANAAGVSDFQIFGEVSTADDLQLSTYVRDRGLPDVLDFPFQADATQFVAGRVSADVLARRFADDDYFRLPDGRDPMPVTFLGNHDMGRAAFQVATAGVGFGSDLLQRLLLGYDLLYFLRGAPVVMYGDEVGMIGTGGDQQARQDMFPTQVADWKTQPRVGSPPIGDGSSFDVTDNPIEIRLRRLSQLRDQNPALATGASIVRYAKGGVLAVSRVDAASRREYLALFNSGDAPATITVPTSTPSSVWRALFGDAGPTTSDVSGRLTVMVPAADALLLEADKQIPEAPAPQPKLRVRADGLSNLWAVGATVSGSAPVTVAFAVRRTGSTTWQRLDVDDSPPYRAFLDPARFHRNEQVQLVAIARALDGSTSVSQVVSFRVHGR
jgi:alpha-amylase